MGQESYIVLFYIINLGKVYKSQIYRVYLLFKMNAKYISSSAVINQYFHECVARVDLLIFSPHFIYLVFTEKESKFSLYFILSSHFSSDLEVSLCLYRITLGFHHSLHLENSLEEHFN